MKTHLKVTLAPTARPVVTPAELLEDFADSVPRWHYLDEDSRYYAAARQGPGCVLRTFARGRAIDLAFSAEPCGDEATTARAPAGEAPATLCLQIVAPTEGQVPAETVRALIEEFVMTFRRYLKDRRHLVALEATEPERELELTA